MLIYCFIYSKNKFQDFDKIDAIYIRLYCHLRIMFLY